MIDYKNCKTFAEYQLEDQSKPESLGSAIAALLATGIVVVGSSFVFTLL